ncbi:MAG: aminotransferase class I/II-fold pyridoxal phosphate-dependent enzyme [Gammaproteobacteria bacterium]|nr:aminotransferase class I/II-fold pyridoxal phosphate-dependent enzyme [Gammaproteobacteria bacterium]
MKDSQLKTAHRVENISPFRVMKVLQRARQLEAEGKKIVHMEVGEPDFSTAQPIVNAAQVALKKGYTHYSTAAGLPELREAISRLYADRYHVSIDPQRIFITPGASGGLNLLANLLVDQGAGVLMTDPAYPCNRNYIRLMGAQPQLIPVGPESNYQPTIALLNEYVRDNTCGLWLASPANPTGTIISRQQLGEINEWAGKHNLHLLLDEIYHGLHYVDDLPSLLELNEQGFVVNSFSKYYGMTGWRVGWIVVPEQFISQVDMLCQNLFIAASTISQYAALAAFSAGTVEILEQRRADFRRRRDFLHGALSDIGFTIDVEAEGAFYIYAGIEKFSDNSEEFCRKMLEQYGVAITPGTDFGDYRARQFVRFAYTTDMENLALGVERLARGCALL